MPFRPAILRIWRAIVAFGRWPAAAMPCLALLAVVSAAHADPPKGAASRRDEGANVHAYTNHLIESNDPYLLLHAHNPVDWYPWGPEALEKAKRENKPIFLSVGYSTCFWCHVAERLIYSDPKIAELMNQWFVNIKVDREQRPDLDRIYMLATELMTGHGGWPNNVFLTPDLKPFFAGSYFPPHDDGGRPGFPSILESLHQLWAAENGRVLAEADRVFKAIRDFSAEQSKAGATPAAISPHSWLTSGTETARSAFDDRHGGFGGNAGPKFPQAPLLGMVLAHERMTHDALDREILAKTLDEMAQGGVYDHLAGGFHRYSTEPTWSVPHFEKMLYDNAQLLQIYAQAYAQLRNPLYRYIAHSTARFMLDEMRAKDGAFYTAQDAEVNGLEGASYVWNETQVREVLGADTATFLSLYALTPLPRSDVPTGVTETVTPGAGVVRVRSESLAKNTADGRELVKRMQELAPLRVRMLAARNRRPQPLRDDKQIVALNALAIIAFERSGELLGRAEYTAAAARAADSIWRTAYDTPSGRLRHEVVNGRAQTAAYLDDYALLGLAMLSIHQRSQQQRWLDRALRLADQILVGFTRQNGRLALSASSSSLPIETPDMGDDTQPSGTSAGVALLLQLGRITGQVKYLDAGRNALAAVSAQVQRSPKAWPSLITALAEDSPGQPAQVAASSLPTMTGNSADVVKVTATVRGGAEQRTVAVVLQIAAGFHINANPASLDYLIPTVVALDGQPSVKVHYPKPLSFRPKFVDQALSVYQGEVRFDLDLPSSRASGQMRGTAHLQACTEDVCLLPATIDFSVIQ